MSENALNVLAGDVVARLRRHKRRLVLAESCTGGLVAATLATIPGVSDVWCGSAVTYREHTKVSWLGVAEESIQTLTAVSPPVAHQMAVGALRKTPEADLAAAITGHLGPNAPNDQDGLVFVGIADAESCNVTQFQLQADSRVDRQREAAEQMLNLIVSSFAAKDG